MSYMCKTLRIMFSNLLLNIPSIYLNIDNTNDFFPLPNPSFETNFVNISLFNLKVTKKIGVIEVDGSTLVPTIPNLPNILRRPYLYNILKIAVNGELVDKCN